MSVVPPWTFDTCHLGNQSYFSGGDRLAGRALYGAQFRAVQAVQAFHGRGDVNGDGMIDLIDWSLASGMVSAFTSNGTSFDVGWPPRNFGSGGTVNDRFFEVADINGDGRSDIIRWEFGIGDVVFALSTGSAFAEPQSYYFGAGGTSMTRFFQLADLNGDGRDDLVKWELGSGMVSWALSTGTGFGSTESYYFGAGGSTTDRFFRVADLNGDGRNDLIRWELGSGLVSWALWTESGFGAAQSHYFGAGGETASRFFEIGDVNGDNRADIVRYELPSGNAAWATFGVDGLFHDGGAIYLGSGGSNDTRHFAVADVDGDCRADLVKWERSPSGILSVHRSTGSGLEEDSVGEALLYAGSSMTGRFDIGDLEGDGTLEAFGWNLLVGGQNWLSAAANPATTCVTDNLIFADGFE